MPLFIEIFLTLCLIAQPHYCGYVQPSKITIPEESARVDHKSTIFSLINYAANVTACEVLKAEPKFLQLEEYCERPLPGTPSASEFLSHEVVLCMVLYDAVRRFCKVGHKEVAKDIQNFSGVFSCDTMINGVTEPLNESAEQWAKHFKAILGTADSCKLQCVQNETVSPVCEYIWKVNILTSQTQMSSAISAGELNFVLVG
jgi:hypothetical protein